MTKEEAIKSLLNTKVYTDGHSKEIQTKLFDLGFSWLSRETVCQYFDNPFLYISEDKTITRASNMVTFKEEDGYKEIPATYILSLKWEEFQFKDGDILVASDGISDKTIIFKNIPYNGCVNYHALYYQVRS